LIAANKNASVMRIISNNESPLLGIVLVLLAVVIIVRVRG